MIVFGWTIISITAMVNLVLTLVEKYNGGLLSLTTSIVIWIVWAVITFIWIIISLVKRTGNVHNKKMTFSKVFSCFEYARKILKSINYDIYEMMHDKSIKKIYEEVNLSMEGQMKMEKRLNKVKEDRTKFISLQSNLNISMQDLFVKLWDKPMKDLEKHFHE